MHVLYKIRLFFLPDKEDNEMCHTELYPLGDFLFYPSCPVLRVYSGLAYDIKPAINQIQFFPLQVTNRSYESVRVD